MSCVASPAGPSPAAWIAALAAAPGLPRLSSETSDTRSSRADFPGAITCAPQSIRVSLHLRRSGRVVRFEMVLSLQPRIAPAQHFIGCVVEPERRLPVRICDHPRERNVVGVAEAIAVGGHDIVLSRDN